MLCFTTIFFICYTHHNSHDPAILGCTMKFNPAASIATRNANKASRRELLIKGVLLMACYFLFKFIYSKHGHQLQEFTPPSQTISIATTVGHPVPDPQLWKRPLGNNLALLSVVDHTPALKGQSLKVAMENIHMFAKSHPLFELVIPSLVATAEREMTYSLYFGYTYEDPLFDDDQARKSMINILESIIPKHTSNIIVKFLPLYSLPNEVSRLNYLADKAFRDNADYFLHIGQATRFLTDKWASIMTKELATNEIAPGFGVALLRHRGETHRPRFPMVSKRHIELMNGVYLPLPFEGYVYIPILCLDDCMSARARAVCAAIQFCLTSLSFPYYSTLLYSPYFTPSLSPPPLFYPPLLILPTLLILPPPPLPTVAVA